MQLSSCKLISHRDALDFSAPYSDSCWSEWCFSCKMHFCEQAYMRHTKIQNVYDKTWENTSIVNTLICFKINNFSILLWGRDENYQQTIWFHTDMLACLLARSDTLVCLTVLFCTLAALELHYFGLAPRMNVLGKNILFRDWMRFFYNRLFHLFTTCEHNYKTRSLLYSAFLSSLEIVLCVSHPHRYCSAISQSLLWKCLPK